MLEYTAYVTVRLKIGGVTEIKGDEITDIDYGIAEIIDRLPDWADLVGAYCWETSYAEIVDENNAI